MNNVHVPVRVCVGHLIYRHYEELPLCNRNIYMGQSPEQGPPFMLCPLTTDAWYRILLQEKCDVRMSGGSLYKASNDSYFNVPFILPGKQRMCGLSSCLLPSNQGLLSCQHQWAHGCWWASPLLTPRPASPLQPSAEVNVVCLENDSVPKDHANLVSDSPRVQPSSCSQKWGLWKRWAWCWSWVETVLQLSCEAGPSPAFRQTSKGLILQLPWWKKRKGQGEGGGNM